MKRTVTLLVYIIFFIATIAQAQEFQRQSTLLGLESFAHHNGVAVADFDGDLDLDFYVVRIDLENDDDPTTQSKLYRNNNNGTFTDVTEEAGLTNILVQGELENYWDEFDGLEGYKYGAHWADYDNDGYPDLFLTSLAKLMLFKNNGDGTFQDVTEAAGILKRNQCGNMGATWFDFNNDGFLDLYINDWRQCDFNTFYVNNGDGTFTNRSDIIRVEMFPEWPNYAAIPFDFNADGFMDLYVTTDLRKNNQLYINVNGDHFVESAAAYGINTTDEDMGVAIADFDSDSQFDLFVTAADLNFLQHNNSNGTFTDIAADNGVNDTGWSWGSTFADFDLDGDEDLYICNGFSEIYRGPEANFYYKSNYGAGSFGFEHEEMNDEGVTMSVTPLDFDYDNDGDLDLIVTNSDQASFFYENLLITDPNASTYKWLSVRLEGTVSNRNAFGTALKLETTEGDLYRYFSGSNFLGQSIKPVHFGLKPTAEIIKITAYWPSGIVQEFLGLDENTHIKLTENGSMEVLPIAVSEKKEGCTDPFSCNYDPEAVIDDGSCEYLSTSGTIMGSSSSSYFKTEIYSYDLENGNEISWNIINGEILSMIDEQTIEVKWGFEPQGRVKATVSNSTCTSSEIDLPVSLGISDLDDQISIARLWNEALLFCIREDFARPTVHARNLFHVSAAMYDAWAIYNNNYRYLIGNDLNGFNSTLNDFPINANTAMQDVEETISYAAYRLLWHRFSQSPHLAETRLKLNTLMNQLGYSTGFNSTDYSTGNPAALGNFIAQTYIDYGLADGSREATQYDNDHYQVTNEALAPAFPGNPNITDPNRWQSLSLDTYIDQAGNIIEGTSIGFLSPEWGNVWPFAMTDEDAIVYDRDGDNYIVYNDPGTPPHIGTADQEASDAYKWGFSVVSVWSSHLDPHDGVMWDISPLSIGNLNIENFPTGHDEFTQFYDLESGGVSQEQGRTTNPITGQAYEPQIVPRGDYTRVLAEFWADGPDSETPPGHWFVLLNGVNDHPDFERKFNGQGDELSPLEWDVKAYFTLGGTMHDAAITAWSVKGWYDYIRPISAIRYMADQGQSTSPTLPNYNENGIKLIAGFIEQVTEEDELSGYYNEHVGKIKLLAWRGHPYISDTETDEAGVGWILAEDWWPYQRPSFVTPPFAGYVSGHSTYSRAAAEVMTELTGSEYFPGGIGEFVAPKNEFLVFEEGPSVDVILQWATYRDASDQCSLSRIWGGIHPPIDDIPGRKIGEKVGKDSYAKALTYFKAIPEEPEEPEEPELPTEMVLYPNPVIPNGVLNILNTTADMSFTLVDMYGRPVAITKTYLPTSQITQINIENLAVGTYVLVTEGKDWKIVVN